jgi:hypothetical protein
MIQYFVTQEVFMEQQLRTMQSEMDRNQLQTIGIGMGFNFFYMACYNPRYGFSQRSDGIHMRSAVGNSVGKGYRTYRNIRILL